MRLTVYVKNVPCENSDSCLTCPIRNFEGKYDRKNAYLETVPQDIMGGDIPKCVVDITLVEENIEYGTELLRMVEKEARKVNGGRIEAHAERKRRDSTSVHWYEIPPGFLRLDLTNDKAIERTLKIALTSPA